MPPAPKKLEVDVVPKEPTKLDEYLDHVERRIDDVSSTAAALFDQHGGGLYSKMAEVLGEIESIEKNGHAEVKNERGAVLYRYDYILESDLMAAVRPKLAERGIAVFYSDEIIDRDGNRVTIRVRLTLVDGATGERETLSADHDATDRGDKAAAKAKTSAVRYLLWKNFLVPSDLDPEQENVEQRSDEKKTEPRRPAGRSGGATDRSVKLRKAIGELAGELDEVQGSPPGTAFGALTAQLDANKGRLDDLPDDDLVWIGTELRRFVESERARGDAAPAELPRLIPDSLIPF